METIKTTAAKWGVASLVSPGQDECGDRCVVQVFDGGGLVVAIDALGHGHDAAVAAEVAAGTIEQHARESPQALLLRCQAELRTTRGAAISMARFDWRLRIMTWLGIGNVAGVLMHANPALRPRVHRLLVHGGVVGYNLPEVLHPSVFEIMPDDTLVLATDGVRDEFTEMLPATATDPQRLAKQILDGYARRSDDALVVVFRCGNP
jgi:phosphoserine phosphatase RsbX